MSQTRDPRIERLEALLDEHRSSLIQAVEAIPAERRDERPDEGRWSVAEVLEHLAATERAITGLLKSSTEGAGTLEAPEPFDPVAFAARLDMPFFLDRSNRIRGSQPAGQLDARSAAEALAASRVELRALLDTTDGRGFERLQRPHPATGTPLDGYQWVAFVALHEGRHAAQVEEIGASLAG